MNKQEKAEFVSQMKEMLTRAEATFLVDYQGLDVEAMTKVRGELRKAGAEIHVVKNRLLALASQDTDTETIKEHLVGPCALAITYEDLVQPAKALVTLSKDFKKLEIKVGQMAGRVMDFATIKRLAELPGREELLAMVLAAMNAVPTSFVRVLNGTMVNLLNVLKAIETKKDEEK